MPFIYRIVKWTTILVIEGLLIMFFFWIYPQKQGVLEELKKSLFVLVSLPILLYFVFAVLENEAKKAKEFSTIDAMTELYNHRYFFERFEEELKRAKRFSLPLSLLISDVDNFKDYVDNNGHQWADFTLKDLGRLAKKIFALLILSVDTEETNLFTSFPLQRLKIQGCLSKGCRRILEITLFRERPPGILP